MQQYANHDDDTNCPKNLHISWGYFPIGLTHSTFRRERPGVSCQSCPKGDDCVDTVDSVEKLVDGVSTVSRCFYLLL